MKKQVCCRLCAPSLTPNGFFGLSPPPSLRHVKGPRRDRETRRIATSRAEIIASDHIPVKAARRRVGETISKSIV